MRSLKARLCVCLIWCFYLPLRILPRRKKVLFLSRQGDKPAVDFRLLAAEIEKVRPDYRVRMGCKVLRPTRSGLFRYSLHMLWQLYQLATARICILDSYAPAVCILKPKRLLVVQVWHSLGSVKQFGLQSVGRPGGRPAELAKILRMHQGYDIIFAAGEVTKSIYSKAFNCRPDQIRVIGMPRIDELLRPDEETRKKIARAYPGLFKKPLVLYVPTFRKKPLEADSFIQSFDFEQFDLVVKLHPLDRSVLPESPAILDRQFEAAPFIKVADKVITDYSALSIEASLLDRPVYFYVYDIEEYRQTNGLNFDMEKADPAAIVFRDGKALAEALKGPYPPGFTKTLRQQYVARPDRGNTKRIIAAIFEEWESRGKK